MKSIVFVQLEYDCGPPCYNCDNLFENSFIQIFLSGVVRILVYDGVMGCVVGCMYVLLIVWYIFW